MKEILTLIVTNILAILKGVFNGKRWRQLLTLMVTLWNEDLFDDPTFREVIHKLIDKNQAVPKKILRQRTSG
ncbi:hypothetical protein THII_2041 [Thioploca ingrica]|uniref:Uncharacterized protein n=1 Tax=Thioploca ingrica TaxID=40754 RepID=A0A090AEE8_9GAMM|nr:hypothetical protein THII_2041 [Thioploca ingrica]